MCTPSGPGPVPSSCCCADFEEEDDGSDSDDTIDPETMAGLEAIAAQLLEEGGLQELDVTLDGETPPPVGALGDQQEGGVASSSSSSRSSRGGSASRVAGQPPRRRDPFEVCRVLACFCCAPWGGSFFIGGVGKLGLPWPTCAVKLTVAVLGFLSWEGRLAVGAGLRRGLPLLQALHACRSCGTYMGS